MHVRSGDGRIKMTQIPKYLNGGHRQVLSKSEDEHAHDLPSVETIHEHGRQRPDNVRSILTDGTCKTCSHLPEPVELDVPTPKSM